MVDPRCSLVHFPPPIAVSAPARCATLDDARRWVEYLYSPALWDRMVHATTSSDSSNSDDTAIETGELMHVSSLYRAPPTAAAGDGGSLYTLRVGPSALSHPHDRFCLSLSRALASTVLYSGRILREEPHLQCGFDGAFAGGLLELRSLAGLHPLPNIAVLTRGRGDALDFTHPLFDASEQAVNVYYARPDYGEHVRQALLASGAPASAILPSASSPTCFSVPLSYLFLSSRSDHALSADIASVTGQAFHGAGELRHPTKRVHFTCVDGESVERVCERIQQAARAREKGGKGAMNPFLRHVSVEAGPTATHGLYASSSEPPLVRTLLLTVYSGPLPPRQYRRLLVFPAAALASPALIERPPPTLTQSYIDRHYDCMSRHRSRSNPDWTFFWYERKQR